RLDHHLIPKERPVGTVVAQQHARGLAPLHRLPHALPAVLLAIAPLEDAQVLAQQVIDRIAAHGGEGGIGVDDGLVGSHGIADHDALGRAVDDHAPGFCRPVVHSLPPINVRNPSSAPEPRRIAAATPARAATPAYSSGPAGASRRARGVSRGVAPRPAPAASADDPAVPLPRRAGCTPAACRNPPTAPASPGPRCPRTPPRPLPSTDRRRTLPPGNASLRVIRRESRAPTGWKGPHRRRERGYGPPSRPGARLRSAADTETGRPSCP